MTTVDDQPFPVVTEEMRATVRELNGQPPFEQCRYPHPNPALGVLCELPAGHKGLHEGHLPRWS